MTGEAQVALTCAGCGRKVRPAALYHHAVTLVRRTCPGCRQLWLVKLEPMPVRRRGVLAVHVATWTRL